MLLIFFRTFAAIKPIKLYTAMNRSLLVFFVTWLALSARAITVTDTIFSRSAHDDYAFGADVSFVPMMESWGTRWLDKNGVQKDILQILKEQGINNIRLRVWTVASGASSKQEVVAMCKRAKEKGLGVMIDFHYSDTWADPGSQTIPSAWTDHSVEALSQRLYDHTYDVLKAIKDAGVVPRWVQVGNETKRGMLYPVGQTNKGGSVAFAKFVLSGYNAVKAVDSTMQVIVHLPDGHDNSLYRSIFDGLKKNGAKWDIIGLSAYPRWSHLDGPTMITRVMANINDLKSRYGTPCMVVETGHYPKEAVIGNQYLVGLMDKMIKNKDLGCFYWEPESMGGYDMGAWDEATRKPTVMMDAFLGVKHTEVNWLMKAAITAPGQDESVEGQLVLKADVRHIRPNRLKSVQFFMDKKAVGTLSQSPYELPVAWDEAGVHTAWLKVADTDGFTMMSDTVAFFTGASADMGKPAVSDAEQKGGKALWDVSFADKGRYRILFQYTADYVQRASLKIGGDSLGMMYFMKSATANYLAKDIEIGESGEMPLELTAQGAHGLPSIAWLRIFPLDGQPVPTSTASTSIAPATGSANDAVEIYSLSGMLLGHTTLSQLGIDLGMRPSAVVSLRGGEPRIVVRSKQGVAIQPE